MLSLLTGLGIGLVVVLLVWINQNKKEEANRGQLQESALRLKMLEEQMQRAEAERVLAATKAEQKQLEIQDLLSENAGMTRTLEFTREQLNKSQSELNEIKSLLQVHQKEAGDLRQSLTGFQEQNRYLLEKQESLKKEFEDIRRQSQLEFQNLAQKILEEKSLKFTASNKENIDNILKPLGENLEHFKKKIEETYDKES
ncbi:MAG TPA: hypothetical protein VFX48_07635, partial [Saprospiraceae bacterium]|nr:hypothetical protein [Saprospiraceae bacterium]